MTGVTDPGQETVSPAAQPLDEHNRALLENTHPSRWRNPQPRGRYNMVVVGAGSAGLVTAAGAAGLGARVALVERDLLGGDCLNVGCVPSKALIRAARARFDAGDAVRFGVSVPGRIDVDFPAVMERMRRLRARISHNDSARRFQEELGVDVFLGQAAFTSSDTIQVGDHVLRFARACIATGARPAVPPVEGLAQAGFLTNETVFSLTELPQRLLVIGGGPIGCEMAQAFARFGARVTLVETNEQILAREDRDAAERIEKALARDGVKIMRGARVRRVGSSAGARSVHLETGERWRAWRAGARGR